MLTNKLLGCTDMFDVVYDLKAAGPPPEHSQPFCIYNI